MLSEPDLRCQGLAVGIDIGGTNTRIALFPSFASSEHTLLATFPTSQSYEEQVQQIVTVLSQTSQFQIYSGIGLSLAGRIAPDGKSVIVAPNLPAYVGKPLVCDLFEQFKCSVRLAHDAVCGLLAEKKFGSLASIDRCAYLTVSTGTGAAIHLAKDDLSLTSSIEIGHQILDGNTRVCLCGQTGCLETFTGGKQLELRYGVSPAQLTEPAFWDTFCEKLALGIVNLAMLTRIEVVAISGAIILNNPALLALVQQKIDTLIRNASVALRLAVLGEQAPLVGAALLLVTPESIILH
ncbi:MAG: ROK family protein [Chloroflexota bacterium]|nr:ROK family protein [Chloroflexota bacterium]